jgi:hypothetical protein
MNQLYFEGRVVDLYAEDYQYLQDSVASESLKFFKSFIAGDLSSAVVKGFTLQIDPSDTTKLYINQNGVTGGVVTASGLLILANTNEAGITLSNYTLGTVNNVYAKCSYVYGSYNRRTGAIVENEKKAVDLYDGTLIYNRKIEDLSFVVYTTSEYNALSTSAKSELVYLGSTTAQGAGSPLTAVDTSTVSFIYLNIPDHQVDLDNLVLGFKLPQSMVCPTSTGDIVDNLTYPLAAPDNLTDDLNIVRTQIRNIKQTVRWDDFQTGAFASDPDTDILHRTGVAPSLYNTYNDFNYTLSSSGTVITIGTGKALIRESKHIELEETSFAIPSSVNNLITSEVHAIAASQPVSFNLDIYPITSSGGVSLQVYSSTGELYIEDTDYTFVPATGEVTTVVGGDIVGENVYCTYYASGYRCDIIACSTTDLIYLEGTPTIAVQTNPPAITSSGLLPLFYIYRNPLVDAVSDNDIIDSRIWLEPVKEVRELTTSDLTSYASSTGGYHPTHTNALGNMAFYLVSGDTLESIGSNWYVTSTGDTEYITMTNTTYMTTYVYTRPNDKVWIIVRPQTSNATLTLTYETVPGSGTLDGTSTKEVPYVSSYTYTLGVLSTPFVPIFFDNLSISDGLTKFKLVITSGASIDFSTILIGDSDLRYLSTLMDSAAANLDAYVNRGSTSSYNLYIGHGAYSLLDPGSLGSFNSVIGYNSLQYGAAGSDNTALGTLALNHCSEGSNNTAIGSRALKETIDGSDNTAIGASALDSNIQGVANTAIGSSSLGKNTSGDSNTGIGYLSLYDNTVGDYNTAIGRDSLPNNISGSYNTALGAKSLYTNTSGLSNVGIGYSAGYRSRLSNKLYIDNQDRGSQNAELSNSLIVGTFASTSANQNVTINGSLVVGHGIQVQWTSAQLLGSTLTVSGGVGNSSLCSLNETDVAFVSSGTDTLRTYRFNGTTWTTVGFELAVSGDAYDPALCSLNGTDVAFVDDDSGKLRTYRFNFSGGTWTSIGSDLIISGVGYPALCSLNGTDVAFVDGTQKKLRTYRFNGTTWTSIGSDLIISGVGYPALCSLNGTDVAFVDGTQKKLRTYRFNGTTWTSIGSDLYISSAAPSLCSLNGTDIVCVNNEDRNLKCYRFGFSLSSPYRWW